MANYVDYDYWIQGYGDGDLSQPDFYVVPGYWEAGYAQYDETGSSAEITASAIVAAVAVDFTFASAEINCFANVSALPYPDPYVEIGYWIGGYCEYDDISPVGRIIAQASVSAKPTRITEFSGDISGNALLTAFAEVNITGSASASVFAYVSAAGNYEASGSGSMYALAEMGAIVGLPVYIIAANVSEVRITNSVSAREVIASVQAVNIDASTSYRE